MVSNEEGLSRALARKPDLALIDGGSFHPESEALDWLATSSDDRPVPILLLASERAIREWETSAVIDDFVLEPVRRAELASRIRRMLSRAKPVNEGETITRGDLIINDASYEVKVGQRKVDLTYREYQLLKYLASYPGRVITRETLLNKVWGFDYFGGDRTVDVHIRRLRSKLEDGVHTFIETVRNVGYRFSES